MRKFIQKLSLSDPNRHPTMKSDAATHPLERKQDQETRSPCGQDLELKYKRCKTIVVIRLVSIKEWRTVPTLNYAT